MAALKCNPYGCKCLKALTATVLANDPVAHAAAFLAAIDNGHKKPQIQAARAAGKRPVKFSIHSF